MLSYILKFGQGYGLRTDPEPFKFIAHDDQAAIYRAKEVLGIENELTKKEFHSQGGKLLLRLAEDELTQIFPPLPEEISVILPVPEWDESTKKKWFEFRKWIEAKGGKWQEDIVANTISFIPIED